MTCKSHIDQQENTSLITIKERVTKEILSFKGFKWSISFYCLFVKQKEQKQNSFFSLI